MSKTPSKETNPQLRAMEAEKQLQQACDLTNLNVQQ